MHERRVVITGMGCVTTLGDKVDQVWSRILAGDSGIGPIRRFDTTDFATRFAGEIFDWPGHPKIDPRVARRLDRFAVYALAGAIDAVEDSGLDFPNENRWRCGSIIGSGIGGIEAFEEGYKSLAERGPSRVSPFLVPKLMCNAGSGNVSIHFNLQGPNSAVATACASAAHAMGDAVEAIRNNAADVMITGGSEAACTPLGVACFCALKALSKRNDDPTHASRPFDRDRDGFILSEGSGILIFEELEHAKARNAKIYAEIVGWGQSADDSHITAPDEEGRGAAYAMECALRDAGLNIHDVNYINAHGTSTGLGDLAETRAIKRVFKDIAKQVPISSTKSMTGHLLGASGGIEAIFAVKAIHESVIPPTINLDNPDEGCDLDYVPHTPRQANVDVAMSNSFGFGGHNVALVFKKM